MNIWRLIIWKKSLIQYWLTKMHKISYHLLYGRTSAFASSILFSNWYLLYKNYNNTQSA
jgi:hypothetical protein